MNSKHFGTLLLAVAVQACAAGEAERACMVRRLASDSEWIAVSFTDESGKTHATDSNEMEFTPVRRLVIRDGAVYVETWGAEPLPTPVEIVDHAARIAPKYLDWLGKDGPIDAAARQVAPYAQPSVTHKLRFNGQCQSSQEMLLEIEEDMVPKGVVKLRWTVRPNTNG